MQQAQRTTQQTQLSSNLDGIVAHLPALVREKQLRTDFVKIAHGTLWDWVAKSTFPPPVKLSSGVTAWKRSDLQAWADGSWTPLA